MPDWRYKSSSVIAVETTGKRPAATRQKKAAMRRRALMDQPFAKRLKTFQPIMAASTRQPAGIAPEIAPVASVVAEVASVVKSTQVVANALMDSSEATTPKASFFSYFLKYPPKFSALQ